MNRQSGQKTQTEKAAHSFSWWKRLLLIPLLLLLPLLLLGFVLWHFGLLFSIWIFWCLKGQNILFVYSDSPNWQEYVEQNFIPRLDDRVVVLNWSTRTKWRNSLAVLAFKRWGGIRGFNPLGVIFRPFKKTRVFRFHQPFLDFKHGKSADLKKMETEFFYLVERTKDRNG